MFIFVVLNSSEIPKLDIKLISYIHNLNEKSYNANSYCKENKPR